MKKRDVVRQLKKYGFWQIKGTKHEKWTNGTETIMLPRHTEINELTAKSIIRDAKQAFEEKSEE